jgi:epoxyqueuosine reductase
MFGCDICQQVCPINAQATPHNEPRFQPSSELLNMRKSDWENLNEETFRKFFKNSAVRRAKYKGLKRNIAFLMA